MPGFGFRAWNPSEASMWFLAAGYLEPTYWFEIKEHKVSKRLGLKAYGAEWCKAVQTGGFAFQCQNWLRSLEQL